VAFWLWHALAMAQGSVVVVTRATPAWLGEPLADWRRSTHTGQPWQMFNRGGTRVAHYLSAHGLDEDGVEHPIPSILDWHVEPRRPYVGHERRRKVASRILGSRGWQRSYARWLCRTARTPEGQSFAEVELRSRLLRLPPPRWLAKHGPLDPYRYFAEGAEVDTLFQLVCDVDRSHPRDTISGDDDSG
jgi:hypothetical protein